MEIRYLVEYKSGVKADKLRYLREAFLPLVNNGSVAQKDLVLHVYGKKKDIRTRFMTPNQYEEYIKAQEE